MAVLSRRCLIIEWMVASPKLMCCFLRGASASPPHRRVSVPCLLPALQGIWCSSPALSCGWSQVACGPPDGYSWLDGLLRNPWSGVQTPQVLGYSRMRVAEPLVGGSNPYGAGMTLRDGGLGPHMSNQGTPWRRFHGPGYSWLDRSLRNPWSGVQTPQVPG